MTNHMRQSKSGGNTCVSSATVPPPIGRPQNTSEAVSARRAGELSSAAIAIMLGSAAPNPRPARKRTATNAS